MFPDLKGMFNKLTDEQLDKAIENLEEQIKILKSMQEHRRQKP